MHRCASEASGPYAAVLSTGVMEKQDARDVPPEKRVLTAVLRPGTEVTAGPTVRARLNEPPGWISIGNLQTQHCAAVQLDECDPDVVDWSHADMPRLKTFSPKGPDGSGRSETANKPDKYVIHTPRGLPHAYVAAKEIRDAHGNASAGRILSVALEALQDGETAVAEADALQSRSPRSRPRRAARCSRYTSASRSR